MPLTPPTLHMLCGKICAGKSTLASRLGREDNTVLITEDQWLSALFGEQMTAPTDYVRCAAKLRTAMGPHISDLLNAGISVVLDFPANTIETRAWMRGILKMTNAAHELHVLAPPDEVCLERLRLRNANSEHPFSVTEEQFRQISSHFVPPTPDEEFNLVLHEH